MDDINQYIQRMSRERGTALGQTKMNSLLHRAELMAALERGHHDENLKVLATTDGRTLERIKKGGGYTLDVGDKPQLWPAPEADRVAAAWNCSSLGAGGLVAAMSWRDHFSAQIERLDARFKAMGSV